MRQDQPAHVAAPVYRGYEEEDTCMSCEEEDTCQPAHVAAPVYRGFKHDSNC
jgi:hypothetical protein